MSRNFLPSTALLMAVGLVFGLGVAAVPARAAEAEPLSPSPSPEVQLLLDEVSPSFEEEAWGDALAAANRALEMARQTTDSAGEALAQRSRAMALEKLKNADGSVAAWLNAAAAWQRTGDGPGEVEALAFAGLLQIGEKTEEAASLVERAVELGVREAARPTAAGLALHNAGQRALELGHKNVARNLFSAAVEIREQIEPDSVHLAESLLGLGSAQGKQKSTLPDARETMTRALAVAETAAPKTEIVARCLDSRGGIEWRQGNIEAARDDHFKAFQILSGINPGSYQLSTVLLRLGNTERVLGLDQAEEHYLRGMEIREQLGAEPREVADFLPGLGMVATYQGEMDKARAYFQRSVEIEEDYGDNPVELARMLINLGWVPTELQQYAEARRHFERALALLEEHAPDHLARAKALGNLAEVTYRQGDLDAAEDYARQALPLMEHALPDSINLTISLSHLGNIVSAQGNAEEARSLHLQALAIREKHIPDSPWVAESLNFLCSVSLDIGDIDAAEMYGERALAIVGDPEGATDMDTPQILKNLGLIARLRGDLKKSEELLRLADAVWQRYGGINHIARSLVLVHLAGTLAAQSAFADAMDVALLANRIERNHARLTVRSLPEREGLEYTTFRVSRDVVLSLAAAPLQDVLSLAPAAWDAVIRSRAMVLDEMASRHRVVRAESDPDLVLRTATLTARRERLARLVVRGPGEEEPATYLAELDQARREKEKAELQLAAISEESKRDLARARFGLEELSAALSPDEAVIAYIRYNQLPFDAYPQTWGYTSDLTTPSYFAFVAAGPDSDPILVRLGPAGDIDPIVSDLRERIANVASAAGRSTRRAEVSYREIGEQLRRRLWDPFLPYLEGSESVFVVPDGPLNLIKFGALPVGESEYLIETGPRIHYLSAERGLLVDEGPPTGKGLLVLGNPAFDEPRVFAALRTKGEEWLSQSPVKLASLDTYRGPRSSCGTFQSLRFESLPASAVEIDQVAELWAEGNPQSPTAAGYTGSPALRLAGPTASEAALKTMASGRRVLHLATHGFFLGGSCRSALDSEGAPNTPAVIGENPLLLSGLAMAGANHREAAGPDEEDGILTAEEIASLDLTGVEWAVLSACDTGVGEVRAGEGVFGLRRAFQIAGVRTLVMSLWPVEDEASREWMTRLYENRFVKSLSTADSVHRASLELLQQRREEGKSTHPFYWAGFVAAGDWR